jgi:hypothetical protein
MCRAGAHHNLSADSQYILTRLQHHPTRHAFDTCIGHRSTVSALYCCIPPLSTTFGGVAKSPSGIDFFSGGSGVSDWCLSSSLRVLLFFCSVKIITPRLWMHIWRMRGTFVLICDGEGVEWYVIKRVCGYIVGQVEMRCLGFHSI